MSNGSPRIKNCTTMPILLYMEFIVLANTPVIENVVIAEWFIIIIVIHKTEDKTFFFSATLAGLKLTHSPMSHTSRASGEGPIWSYYLVTCRLYCCSSWMFNFLNSFKLEVFFEFQTGIMLYLFFPNWKQSSVF